MDKKILEYLVDQLEVTLTYIFEESDNDLDKMANNIFSVSGSTLDDLLSGFSKTEKYCRKNNNNQNISEVVENVKSKTDNIKCSLDELISKLVSLLSD